VLEGEADAGKLATRVSDALQYEVHCPGEGACGARIEIQDDGSDRDSVPAAAATQRGRLRANVDLEAGNSAVMRFHCGAEGGCSAELGIHTQDLAQWKVRRRCRKGTAPGCGERSWFGSETGRFAHIPEGPVALEVQHGDPSGFAYDAVMTLKWEASHAKR
jgi:hypothetical protein